MSRTFSSNCGSFDSLKRSTRWGWISWRCQMRCTMVRLIPNCRASIRTLQCVLPSPGRLFSAVSTIFCSNSAVSTLPWRFRLRIPVTASMCWAAKAARRAMTVGRDIPNCCAMEWLAHPWCANRMMRPRKAIFWGVEPSRTRTSRVDFCCGESARAGAGANMIHGGPARANCQVLSKT